MTMMNEKTPEEESNSNRGIVVVLRAVLSFEQRSRLQVKRWRMHLAGLARLIPEMTGFRRYIPILNVEYALVQLNPQPYCKQL